MRPESAGTRVEALPCNACKRQARFLTPYGLKCPEHALETAIYDETSAAEGWLPIRIRPPSAHRGENEADVSIDSPRILSAEEDRED